MASSPRDVEREEERRLNMRTLTIASAASAAAAAVTSQLWIAGTWIAAALTPVLVALISEALNRPTERVARARTTRRPVAPGSHAAPTPRIAEPEPGSIRVYRQPGLRPSRRRIALGVVAATGALAFVIGTVALTTVDLVSGGSVGKNSGRTTLLGGGGDRGGTSTGRPRRALIPGCAPARVGRASSLGVHPVYRAFHAGLLGAVGTAVHRAVRLDSVADDADAAVAALRRHGVDRALEAVEGVRLTAPRHLERLVVLVAADLALSHWDLLRSDA